MSIKGIDAQIMVARTTDYVRDTSSLQKRPEVMQEHLATREKINDAQDQSKVIKTMETETELDKLRPDEGGGGGGYSGNQNADREQKDIENDPDMFVPPGNSTIDIRV